MNEVACVEVSPPEVKQSRLEQLIIFSATRLIIVE